MTMQFEHDEPWRPAPAGAFRGWNEGKGCPSLADLFLAAAGEPSTQLLEHFEQCSACKRTYELASAPIEAESFDAPLTDEDFLNRATLEVPVISRFAGGNLRALPGRSILLLLVEPRQPGWGKTCELEFAGRKPSRLQPGDADVSWQSKSPFLLQIFGPNGEADAIDLEWEGWGEGVRSVAVAPYPGNVEQSEALLKDYEDGKVGVLRVPIKLKLLREGDVAVAKAEFDNLFKVLVPKLEEWFVDLRGDQDWTEVGELSDRRIQDAIERFTTTTFEERGHLPSSDVGTWLLKRAAAALLWILELFGKPDGAIQKKPDVVTRFADKYQHVVVIAD